MKKVLTYKDGRPAYVEKEILKHRTAPFPDVLQPGRVAKSLYQRKGKTKRQNREPRGAAGEGLRGGSDSRPVQSGASQTPKNKALSSGQRSRQL